MHLSLLHFLPVFLLSTPIIFITFSLFFLSFTLRVLFSDYQVHHDYYTLFARVYLCHWNSPVVPFHMVVSHLILIPTGSFSSARHLHCLFSPHSLYSFSFLYPLWTCFTSRLFPLISLKVSIFSASYFLVLLVSTQAHLSALLFNSVMRASFPGSLPSLFQWPSTPTPCLLGLNPPIG